MVTVRERVSIGDVASVSPARIPVREGREVESEEEVHAESAEEETGRCEIAGEAEPDEYEARRETHVGVSPAPFGPRKP